MGDYKFEILSELVKHDDYEFETVLFGENLEKYSSMLHKMDWYDLLINRVLENDGRWKTIITDKGRNYYFDELLPRRNHILVTTQPIPNDTKQPNKYKAWLRDNSFNIISTIIGLASLYLAYLALN